VCGSCHTSKTARMRAIRAAPTEDGKQADV
jgi:hypothetical protein